MLDVGVSIALAVSIIAAIAATIAIRRADRLREVVRRFRGKRDGRGGDERRDDRREDRFPQFRGTRNQVIVTRSDDGHVITLSLPQNIDTNANVNFQSVTTTGGITAASITSTGPITGASLAIAGPITSTSSTFTGAISAASGAFTGAITAASATLSGGLAAATATLSGALNAASAVISGNITAASATITTETVTNLQVGSGSVFAQSTTPVSNIPPSVQMATVNVGVVKSGKITLAPGSNDFTTSPTQYFDVLCTAPTFTAASNFVLTSIGFTQTGGTGGITTNGPLSCAPITARLVSITPPFSFRVALVPDLQADAAAGPMVFSTGILNYMII